MIYLFTAIGLTPGGSSTVHIYTHTVHRTTPLTQTVHTATQLTNWEECGPCPFSASRASSVWACPVSAGRAPSEWAVPRQCWPRPVSAGCDPSCVGPCPVSAGRVPSMRAVPRRCGCVLARSAENKVHDRLHVPFTCTIMTVTWTVRQLGVSCDVCSVAAYGTKCQKRSYTVFSCYNSGTNNQISSEFGTDIG